MSSIRLYILGALVDEGEMHGHQLRRLAEQEHVQLWTDISVGALYGALKRLAADGLIEEARTERDGAYPERQVWRATPAGRAELARLRVETLHEVVLRPDPVDLALSRLDRDRLDELPEHIKARLVELRGRIAEREATIERIRIYLTPMELFVLQHTIHRLRAEVDWHEQLTRRLPELIADELTRKDPS
ncbi:PadR family transcriptional regulator [Protaetiibacter larvae]|uniref:PadR family transcriptional regulator n=1 Tax=Protaetiibacter larvae TaxID=2592654 RepID=A0A5C1YC54_9MICO|nr:helix-turn-helix transcriptional regulator [Protaetiibacter larvae]QEO10412.1 PadR family transcriptional regulator [Protaetiibacter larvae]